MLQREWKAMLWRATLHRVSVRACVRARVCVCTEQVPGFTADYVKSKGLGLDGALQMQGPAAAAPIAEVRAEQDPAG